MVWKKLGKPDSISLSLPRSRKVCGYEIKKVPLGAYLKAMRNLQDFPAQLMEAIFPGMALEDILQELKGCNTDMLGQWFMRAAGVAPEQVIALVSDLTGIPHEELVQNAAIGLDGFVGILDAWVEVNGIENFIQTVSGLRAKAKALTAETTGFKG